MEHFDREVRGWVIVWRKRLPGYFKASETRHAVDVFFTSRRRAVAGARTYEKMYPNCLAVVCPSVVFV